MSKGSASAFHDVEFHARPVTSFLFNFLAVCAYGQQAIEGVNVGNGFPNSLVIPMSDALGISMMIVQADLDSNRQVSGLEWLENIATRSREFGSLKSWSIPVACYKNQWQTKRANLVRGFNTVDLARKLDVH